MAFSRKFSARRKTYKKRTYKRKSYAPKRKMTSIKKVIRREIARNVENKTQQYYNFQRNLEVPSTGAVFSTSNIFPVGVDPSSLVISQGAGQGQRVGNKIKTKKLMFKGTFNPLPYDSIRNAQPQPVQVKMWIFYDKNDVTAVPNPLGAGDFFQDGSGSRSFAGDLVDLWSPVNTDRYRILATKTFKLGYATYNGQGALPDLGNVSNNDFNLNCNFSFDLTKHYPQMVTFVDTSATPSTRGLFCMVEYCFSQGGLTGSGTRAVNMQYMIDYKYEDA